MRVWWKGTTSCYPNQEINEALDVEKRKDMIVIRGIKESENVEEKVKMMMEERTGVQERIEGLRLKKRGVEEEVEVVAESGKSRLIRIESVADRVIADSRKLSSSKCLKDILFLRI